MKIFLFNWNLSQKTKTETITIYKNNWMHWYAPFSPVSITWVIGQAWLNGKLTLSIGALIHFRKSLIVGRVVPWNYQKRHSKTLLTLSGLISHLTNDIWLHRLQSDNCSHWTWEMNYKGLQSVLFRVKEDQVHVSCVYSLKVLKTCSKLFPAAILNLIEIRRAGN